MSAMPWILISIGILLIILVAVAAMVKRKIKTPTDYYTFFIIGLTWLPLGIIFGNYALSAMGFAFMIAGLVHRKEWKKNHRPWSKLSKEEKNLKRWIMIAIGILVVLGVVALLII